MNAKLLFLVCIRLLILCVGHAEQVRRKRSSSLSSSWELSEYSREREIFGDDKKKAKDRSNLDSTQEEMLHLMRRMKRRRKLRKYNYEGELFPEREKKIGKRVERLKKGGRRACDSNSHSYSHSSESELTKKKKRKPIRSLESYSNERKVNGKRRPESRRKSREHSVASAESHSAEHTKKKAKKPPDVSLPSHSHSEREKSDGGDSDRDSVEESSQRTKYLSSYEDKILQEYEEIQAILHNRTRPRATAVEGVDDYAIDFFESSTTLPKELMMITDYAELHSKLGIRFATYLDLHNRDRALALSKMLCSTTPQLEEEAEQQQQQLHQQQQEQEHHQQPHQDQHQQHEQQQRFEPEMPPKREHAKQHSHENQNRNQKANAKAIYTPPATRKKPKFDEDYHVTRAKTISHNSDSEEAARDKEIYVGRREKERFDKPVRPKHGASSTEEMILKNDKKFRKFFELDSHEPESVAREKERLKTTRTTHLTTSSAELFSKHDKDFRRFFELDSHEPESVAREKARLKTTPTSRRTTSSAELFSKYDKDFRRMLELDSRESDSVKCEKQLSKKTRRPDEEILSDNEYHGQRGKKSAHSKHRGEESKQYEQENENENENENESENENVKSNASPEKRLQDISASRIQKRPPSHEYDSSNATIPPLSHLDAALPFYEEFEGTKNKKIPDKAERLKIFQEMQQDILVEHKKMKGPKINEKLLDPISKKHVFSHPYYKAKAMSKELQKELEKRQRSEKASHRRRKRQIYQNTELATPNTLNCSPFSEMSENKEQHNETSIRTHITSEPRRALHSDPSKPDKMFTTTFHVSQTKRKIKDQTILEYMEGLSTEERRNVEDAYNQYMCDSISKSLIRESGSL